MTYEGLSASDLARRLEAPACIVHARVGSTLDEVHRLAREGAPSGTVVIADEQTRGRGRRGARWHSPPGTGIWMAVLVRPSAPPVGGVLSIRSGIAIVRALEALGVDARLKWPNDVMGHERKLGGVLCETRWTGDRTQWSVVGIGLNVHGPVPDEIQSTAITINDLVSPIERITVLEALGPRLHGLGEGECLTNVELECYRRVSALLGRRIVGPMAGVVRGIDVDGSMMVDTGTRICRVVGGSVVPA